MVVQQILVDSIYRFSVARWIFASAERGGQERRPKVSRPGESISFRFRGTTGWTRDLISATRIVPPTVKWDRFRVTRSNDCVSVCLFKREKEAFRLSFVPPGSA